MKRGRKRWVGIKKRILSCIGPEGIWGITVAAVSLDTTTSQVLETAAKEWLERHRVGKR